MPSIPITLAENLVVTKAIEKRLRKKAEIDIPPTEKEKLGNQIPKWSVLIFLPSAYFVANAIFPEFSGRFWLVFFCWVYGGPLLILCAIDLVLSKPRKARAERIALKTIELAEARKRIIEEALSFYSSPEWALIRKQVIMEEGPVCAECDKWIKNEIDITVDHKRPRSKFPNLALDRENLRVLCRKCNSKKGARFPDL